VPGELRALRLHHERPRRDPPLLVLREAKTMTLRSDLGPLPSRMQLLPIDERGYPVPWFVAWIDGRPDFRVADGDKRAQALRHKLCWVCGAPLGRWLAFVLGPMCTITRTTTEPPTHRECAEWSARHCPFLVQPRAVRRDANLPAEAESPGGLPILRNPGVAAIWITRGFEQFDDGRGHQLITVGRADEVVWYCEGRPATRAEVIESVESGMPALLTMAKTDGPFAVEELGKQAKRAERYYPSEAA
jgi:hypothetical protein